MGEVRYLLDTHTLLWWWGEPERLSKRALALLKDPGNSIVVSATSALEISIKTRIGKLPGGTPIIQTWSERLLEDGFNELAVSSAHALKAGNIPNDHRDPFDRILAAQSLLEKIPIIGCDSMVGSLGAEQIW